VRILIVYNLPLPRTSGPDSSIDPADDDTRVQAEFLAQTLERQGHTLLQAPLPASATLEECLELLFQARGSEHWDLAWNLMESVMGSSRLACQAPVLINRAGLPCTGSGAPALMRSTNKLLAKQVLSRAGLPTPPGLDFRDAPDSDVRFPGSWIVKSVWEHASLGLGPDSVLHRPTKGQALEALAEQSRRHGGEWFIEAYVEGREMNIALLADATPQDMPEVLPPAEILFRGWDPARPRIVDHAAKWNESDPAYANTVRRQDFPASDRALLMELAALARQCWRLFDLEGYARVDFRVDDQGRPWIIDINANPCLAPDSGFVAALAAASCTVAQALERIQQAALQ
jgi:D-alanine-D-alanine ligase